jgi:hypothetical protein
MRSAWWASAFSRLDRTMSFRPHGGTIAAIPHVVRYDPHPTANSAAGLRINEALNHCARAPGVLLLPMTGTETCRHGYDSVMQHEQDVTNEGGQRVNEDGVSELAAPSDAMSESLS